MPRPRTCSRPKQPPHCPLTRCRAIAPRRAQALALLLFRGEPAASVAADDEPRAPDGRRLPAAAQGDESPREEGGGDEGGGEGREEGGAEAPAGAAAGGAAAAPAGGAVALAGGKPVLGWLPILWALLCGPSLTLPAAVLLGAECAPGARA